MVSFQWVPCAGSLRSASRSKTVGNACDRGEGPATLNQIKLDQIKLERKLEWMRP